MFAYPLLCMTLCYFQDDKFSDQFMMTIGVDFKYRMFPVDDRMTKLQIWDTAGQERFRTITSAYYRNADGIIVVYDVTNRDSFDNVNNWFKEINKLATKNICMVLVGNKCDVSPEDILVSTEEGQAKADELGVPFLETSARDATNVEECFRIICKNRIENLDKAPDPETLDTVFSLNQAQSHVNSCCGRT